MAARAGKRRELKVKPGCHAAALALARGRPYGRRIGQNVCMPQCHAVDGDTERL